MNCVRYLLSFVLAAFALIDGASAHSVSVGYISNGTNSITIYYGSYHAAVTTPEGTVSLVGPVTLTQSNSNITATKPSALIDGVNNFYAGSCSGGSLGTPVVWQSATFTGVPSGTYSIQLTGSFSINWQPCDSSISSGSAQFVIDTVPPVISNLPANIVLYTAAGSNTAVATWTAPTATDDIGVTSFTSNYASGSAFPIGSTLVTYTAVDGKGNTTTASFTVTVIDNVPPTISNVPANITLTPGVGGVAIATWTPPIAADNAGIASFTSNYAPGASLPLGTTTITYTAVDLSGNTTTASFTVTVGDTTPPVIASCPVDQTLEATSGAGAVATWTRPTASDNSGAATLVESHAPGLTFPLGTTQVQYTATDASGNAATPCTFRITVRDSTPPVLAATSNIVVTAPDASGVVVNFPLPVATDLVSPSVTVSASPAPGSRLAVGVHTVTVTAVDSAGNQSTSTFTVTVQSPANLSVSPGTDFLASGPQGQQGGAFAPTSQTYTVTNNGQVALDFAVSGAPSWLAIAPASGTLAAGASTTVVMSLTSAVDALGVGVQSAPITFTNSTNGLGTTVRSATLTVQKPATLAISSTTPFANVGPQGALGGSVSPGTTTYTLTNTGDLPMTYAVTGQPGWITASPTSGTIPAGGTVSVTVAVNATANSLAVGSYSGALTITNTTTGIGGATIPVSLNIQEPARLSVAGTDGLTSRGYQGGPFAPATKAYTLSNTGNLPLNYTVATDRTWLSASSTAGTIPAGGTATVSVSLNANAATLAAGSYTATVTFANATSGLGNTTRNVALTVVPNGQVILKVVTSEGDGTFRFTSATAQLSMAMTTSGGVAQSQPITLNPGQYALNVTPPDGFGLTSISCSDTDSTGSPASRSATINLAPAETVVCTFSSVNAVKKTSEVVQRFLSRRNDMIMSNGPDGGRQVDRLIEAQDYAQRGVAAQPSANDAAKPNPLQGEAAAGVGAPLAGRSIAGSTQPGIASSRGQDRLQDVLQSNSMGLGGPMGPSSSEPETPSRLEFAGSLSRMMRLNAESDQRKLEGIEGGAGAVRSLDKRPTYSPFDMWFQGKISRFKDERDGTRDTGHFAALHVGADYVFNPSLLFGVQAQVDSMKLRSSSGSYEVGGTGWMVGPYGTLRLSEHLFLQARAAAGRSYNTVSPFLSYTDNFSTSRWLASATLVGRWNFGAWQFRPSASVSYIEDVSKSYVDSLGVTIPRLKSSLGQATVGPEFLYRHVLANKLVIEPRLSLQAIWNFAGDTQGTDFGGSLAGPKEVRGRAELGLKLQAPNGLTLDLAGSYDGIGSKSYGSTGGKATLRIPLQ